MSANEPSNHDSCGRMDLAAIRAKLNGAQGQQYWRSLDELAETQEFQEMLHREFPEGASEWCSDLNRRSFLKMAAASLALAGLSACTKQPPHEIFPYVNQPEELILGEPLYYATSMTLGGFATGVLVKSREGHPIKIDGNSEHPASLGGSSIWMQASILDLYDPDRSQAIMHQGELNTWASFLDDLNQLIREHDANGGEGLCFLTETVTSPTLAAQLQSLLKRFPRAKWHSFDPISRGNVREGARLAFRDPVETHYRFDRAEVILSLESDFLSTHPQRLRHTREFMDARRVSDGGKTMNRLYVVESTPTITGMTADHRLALASSDIEDFVRAVAQQLSGSSASIPQSAPHTAWVHALAADLQHHRGKSIVIAGECQPPQVHALVHLLNDSLGNVGETVFYTESGEVQSSNQLDSLRELANDIKAGRVQSLVMLGSNPAYYAPADLEFANLLLKIKRTIHLGLYSWHIPEAHYLESWSDARAFDGTASLIQPLIAPLYRGKTAHELLGAFSQQHPAQDDYNIVRDYWRSQNIWLDFEKAWRRALHDGLIANSAAPEKRVQLQTDALKQLLQQPNRGQVSSNLEVIFRPDPSVWDGRYANNGWLQECARPASKVTWDNAVLVSPALAERLQLQNDDVVEVSASGRTIRGPIWIQPGQASNTITLHLGYGRERLGRVSKGAGFNAYALRTSDSFWRASGMEIKKTGASHHLVATQIHHNLQNPERQIYRQGTLSQFKTDEQFLKSSLESPKPEETLYDNNEFKYEGYKWGMSIDLNACIGCNACLVACNVENNIPVVGKEQVDRHREMYWIRIDTYFQGSLDAPAFKHMPVPCMQCEHAPCELVCPVAATVHDHEGLNLQIYNRCVGTRFCSNNCPYKVRRFNFFQYTDYRTPSLKPMYNPEVTVRSRGVMEKCTYCVQRISHARITAEKENRHIREDELQTACQQACPARAIVFGDLNTPDSKVAAVKQHPLDYSMLGELNTRPAHDVSRETPQPEPATRNHSTRVNYGNHPGLRTAHAEFRSAVSGDDSGLPRRNDRPA